VVGKRRRFPALCLQTKHGVLYSWAIQFAVARDKLCGCFFERIFLFLWRDFVYIKKYSLSPRIEMGILWVYYGGFSQIQLRILELF
jgi:hypothetical protein